MYTGSCTESIILLEKQLWIEENQLRTETNFQRWIHWPVVWECWWVPDEPAKLSLRSKPWLTSQQPLALAWLSWMFFKKVLAEMQNTEGKRGQSSEIKVGTHLGLWGHSSIHPFIRHTLLTNHVLSIVLSATANSAASRGSRSQTVQRRKSTLRESYSKCRLRGHNLGWGQEGNQGLHKGGSFPAKLWKRSETCILTSSSRG